MRRDCLDARSQAKEPLDTSVCPILLLLPSSSSSESLPDSSPKLPLKISFDDTPSRSEVALTEKWAETYGDKGIGFYSMHPGWADTPGVAKSLPGFSERLSGKLRTNEEGADTVIWLALQPKENLKSGAFYFDRAEAPKHLLFSGTAYSHVAIDVVVDSIRSLCKLP